MSFYSPIMFLLSMVVMYGFAATPLLKRADSPASDGYQRVQTIDGLRGFAALAVYFHHVALTHNLVVTGSWAANANTFFNNLGPIGVSLFFMVTGYLFWDKITSDKKVDWKLLYVGRFFRIGPLYYLMLVIMLAVVATTTKFRLGEPFILLLSHIGEWACLGVLGRPPINGYADTWMIVLAVTWTLRWEWAFYAVLPILRPIASLRFCIVWLAVAFVVINLVAALLDERRLYLISLFLVGKICATLKKGNWEANISNWLSGPIILAALWWVCYCDDVFSAIPIAILGTVFWLVISGTSVFGLLTSRSAKRLGNLSYGIYLLQGFPILILRESSAMRAIVAQSVLGYWALAVIAGLALIILAMQAHVFIERPGMKLGKSVGSWFRKREVTSYVSA